VVISPGGEVVMLDMGKPVKIVDLARDLISLSGYEIDKDIEIRFTGLRPGEKLFEELFIAGEEYQNTQHEKLLVVGNASHSVPECLDRVVADLQQAAVDNRTDDIYALLTQLVPGYVCKFDAVRDLSLSPAKLGASHTRMSINTD
jgi:FlaA1/EpsC-like NDP-sugar epimerase